MFSHKIPTKYYFKIHEGSFLIVSFSGPRMATPHVLWPALRYLQDEQQTPGFYLHLQQQPNKRVKHVPVPFSHIHQTFLINGEKLLSVTLFHLVCDAAQETTHSCSRETSEVQRCISKQCQADTQYRAWSVMKSLQSTMHQYGSHVKQEPWINSSKCRQKIN